MLTVSLGAGSEPLRLGLCRYPPQVVDPVTGRMRVVRRRVWRFSGFCKTQYAGLHGWENFHRVHIAAVDLLAALRGPGLKVEIMDEGGYWPGRDVDALRRQLDRTNGIVAAFAGAMKDAADTAERVKLQTPIFAHPHFERLEAAGADQVSAAMPKTVKLVRGSRPPDGHR